MCAYLSNLRFLTMSEITKERMQRYARFKIFGLEPMAIDPKGKTCSYTDGYCSIEIRCSNPAVCGVYSSSDYESVSHYYCDRHKKGSGVNYAIPPTHRVLFDDADFGFGNPDLPCTCAAGQPVNPNCLRHGRRN